MCAFAPTASAHHSEPYCYWAQGVLPTNDALRVTVERDHYMQSECDGTTIRMRLADGDEFIATWRTEEERRSAERADADTNQTPATKSKAQKADRCKARKSSRRSTR